MTLIALSTHDFRNSIGISLQPGAFLLDIGYVGLLLVLLFLIHQIRLHIYSHYKFHLYWDLFCIDFLYIVAVSFLYPFLLRPLF